MVDVEQRYRSRTFPGTANRVFINSITYNGVCTQLDKFTTNAPEDYGLFTESSHVESMYDVVTKEFEKKKRQGRIINSPLLKTSVVTHAPLIPYIYAEVIGSQINCSGVWRTKWSGYEVTSGMITPNSYCNLGYSSPPYLPCPVISQNLIGSAVTKAYANCDMSKAAILASLGEARETVASMASIFTGLIRIIREIRSLQIGKLMRRLKPKELADRYMEIRYALRPMVYDTLQIIDAANASAVATRQTYRGFAKANAKATSSGYRTHGTFRRYKWTKTSTTSTEVRAGVLCKCDAFTKLNAWGADSILETAWELIPLSFVVDWFFNVGQTIASWTPETGLTALASWYKITESLYQEIRLSDSSCLAVPNAVKLAFNADGAYVSKLSVTTQRVPDPSRPVLPRFQLSLDALKLVDLMIIARKILS